MLKTAIGFLVGCIVCLQLETLPDGVFWGLLTVPLLLWLRQYVLLSLLLGCLWAAWHVDAQIAQQFPSDEVERVWQVEGRISSIPTIDKQSVKFVLSTDDPQLPQHIRLSWYYPTYPLPQAGETWQFMVKLKPPHGFFNPGSWDYEKWLFSQHIGATGTVKNRL
jgi:competence protein ComEC